jgi:hypothetical protein
MTTPDELLHKFVVRWTIEQDNLAQVILVNAIESTLISCAQVGRWRYRAWLFGVD